MTRHAINLVEIIVGPFMCYIVPQSEDLFSSSRYGSGASISNFNSEKLCLLIFIFALAFIAVISPILCFRSLFININFEGLWYFWLITLFEIGFLVWLISRKKVKKQHEHKIDIKTGGKNYRLCSSANGSHRYRRAVNNSCSNAQLAESSCLLAQFNLY